MGRDALAFAKRGYWVVAFDASRGMARLARERVGGRAEVLRMRFEDVASREEFDGVWACASLLHVPPASFPAAASRLADALRPGGTWYMSFKLGGGERVAEGRLLVDHTEATLMRALAGLAVDVVEHWVSTGVQPGRSAELWVNAVAVRR